MNPYLDLDVSEWKLQTKKLIEQHPVSTEFILSSVLNVWRDILETKIGKRAKVGVDIFPSPQMTGTLIHELLPLEFETCQPKCWRKEQDSKDKDIVCLKDDLFSIEIKCSSSKNKIYGNRSYAQESKDKKKNKDGYYIAINFEKFSRDKDEPCKITMVRFGWLNHTDWIAQEKETGQQARLSKESEAHKLLEIFPVDRTKQIEIQMRLF
jgi:hypothetical protein